MGIYNYDTIATSIKNPILIERQEIYIRKTGYRRPEEGEI